MPIIKTLTKEDAILLLQRKGCRNQKEIDWTRKHVNYLTKSGRHYYSLYLLSKEEIVTLKVKDSVDLNKIDMLVEQIKSRNFDFKSLLFLRDLYPAENSSFFVENGSHRACAFKKLVKQGNLVEDCLAIVISRTKFSF